MSPGDSALHEEPTARWRGALKKAFAWPSVRRSLIATIIVGTAVNAINQGPEMLAGQVPVIWKLALTYCTPFLVVTYGSYSAYLNSL